MYTYVHMKTVVSLDATKVRNDFFNVLNNIFNEDVIVEIKKAGIPVAYLSKTNPLRTVSQQKQALKEFAGAWADDDSIDAEKMVSDIYRWREEGSREYKKTT